MLAFAIIILLIVAVLFLFDRLRAERKSLAEEISRRSRSERQCISAVKWFITVLSAANNKDQVTELLRKKYEVESQQWARDYASKEESKISVDDDRSVQISMLKFMLDKYDQETARK